jgi:hypothetical protein
MQNKSDLCQTWLSCAETGGVIPFCSRLCRVVQFWSVLGGIVEGLALWLLCGLGIRGGISFVAFVRFRNTGRDCGGVVYYRIGVHYRCTSCNQCFKCCPGWQVQLVLFDKNGFIVFARFTKRGFFSLAF